MERQIAHLMIAAIQQRKLSANNNLAGATWEVALSNEMSAIAARCDTKQRELKDRRENLVKECSALGACKP
ncbi:hypothetical protein WG922_20150 [Ramlibacter sp. AN1015]|uniref:hypothetical protein n=1 Tax=Ramlibacter sp. AN1015 TaxID=3133428 RepID=UPI0030C358C3